MSTLLDAEPVVLEESEVTPPCEFNLCQATAAWSALFTCGETILYCDEHLEWMERQKYVTCVCPATEGAVIRLVTVVLL